MSQKKQLVTKLALMQSWLVSAPNFSLQVTVLVTEQFVAQAVLSVGCIHCCIRHGQPLSPLRCALIPHLWCRHWPLNCRTFTFSYFELVSMNVPKWSDLSLSDFFQELEMHFAHSFYDNPKGALFKMSEHDIVNYYLSEFESLANCIVGLPPPFPLSCFISGLSP